MLRVLGLKLSPVGIAQPRVIFRFKSNDQIIEKLESSTCYYKVLGVPEDASQLEIEDAYVSLKSIFDHSKESTFTERRCVEKLDNAYRVLSNIEQRSMYDLKLRSGYLPTSEGTTKSLQVIPSDTAYDRFLMYMRRPKPHERPLYEGSFVRRKRFLDSAVRLYIIGLIVLFLVYVKLVFPDKVKTWRDWLQFPKWYFERRRQIVKHHDDYLRIYHNNAKRSIGDYLFNFPWVF